MNSDQWLSWWLMLTKCCINALNSALFITACFQSGRVWSTFPKLELKEGVFSVPCKRLTSGEAYAVRQWPLGNGCSCKRCHIFFLLAIRLYFHLDIFFENRMYRIMQSRSLSSVRYILEAVCQISRFRRILDIKHSFLEGAWLEKVSLWPNKMIKHQHNSCFSPAWNMDCSIQTSKRAGCGDNQTIFSCCKRHVKYKRDSTTMSLNEVSYLCKSLKTITCV